MLTPENIRWKYFYRESDGKMWASYQEPEENIKKLAPLLLSKEVEDADYFKVLQNMVDNGFCACVPCKNSNLENTSSFSGNLFDPQNSALLADLEHSTSTCSLGIKVGSCPERLLPLSPQEGASQLISAMRKGYDVIDFTGGVCMSQKLMLVKDYFRNEENDLPENKIRFWGFSNDSAPVLYLNDLLQHIHSTSAKDMFLDKTPAGLSTLKILQEGLSEPITKILLPLNKFAREKYNPDSFTTATDILSYTSNAQELLHNFDSFEEWRPPEAKFSLLVEGISNSYGFSPHEAVEKVLAKWQKNGTLARLQHIELGAIHPLKLTQEEEAAIEEICDYFQVALVAKENNRSGHNDHVDVDPSDVTYSLSKNADGKIEQRVEVLLNNEKPKRPQARQALNLGSLEPVWPSDKNISRPSLSKESRNPDFTSSPVEIGELDELEVIAMNSEAQNFAPSAEVIGGKFYNTINQPLNDQKGLFFIGGSNRRNGIALQIQDASTHGRFGKSILSPEAPDLPFIVIAHDLPESENREKIIKWNEALLRKFIETNELRGTPIFHSPAPLTIPCDLFAGQVRLKLIDPNPVINPTEASKAAQTSACCTIS